MRPFEGFQDPDLVRGVVERIRSDLGQRRLRLMEVCGTHTMAMFRHGLRDLLAGSVDLVSGPGCPVCVTTNGYLDRAIEIARRHDGVTIATFGDMLRVPGSTSTLERERAAGADVRVVYSPLDAVEMAAANGRRVVFLGVGFETTAPLVASSILEAERRGIGNFSVLAAHKRVPPALDALAADPEIGVDGFILPGHVSVIIGSRAYASVPERFGIPCVVTGFEPLDMVAGIHRLVRQHVEGRASVESAYPRAVTPEGNWKAQSVLDAVFVVGDAEWRGIGVIPGTGYDIAERFAGRDAARVFPVDPPPAKANPACLCGEVLKGKVTPPDCALFADVCTPDSPTGPCMVSSEGTCAAWYKYGRTE